MPIPWALAFKVIPWTDVIAAAPGVVRNAQKLWKQVGGSAEATEHLDLADRPPEERLVHLEAAFAEMDTQLARQAEVMAELAEQNSRLVEAIEVLRQRTRLLGAAAAVLAIALVLGLVAIA